MSKFKFHYPIEVRFGDLDAYWHGNNPGFLVYLEQARSQYMLEMGLYDGKDLGKLPLIVGDIHCGYHFPIELGDKVVVSMGRHASAITPWPLNTKLPRERNSLVRQRRIHPGRLRLP